MDFSAYVVEPHARHVRQFSPIRGAQSGDSTPRRYQEAREDFTTDYFWIFPNWMLNCYPDNVSLNIVLPVEPERSLAIFQWYLPEKDHASPAAKASVEFSDQIQMEDVGICEAVQKNLRSRSYSAVLQRLPGKRRARLPSHVCGVDGELAAGSSKTLRADFRNGTSSLVRFQRLCKSIALQRIRPAVPGGNEFFRSLLASPHATGSQ